MEPQRYYIGIDGGGTKSTLRVVFENGREPVSLRGGPLNMCSVPQADVARHLQHLFRQALGAVRAGDVCGGIGIGTAGFTDPRVLPFFRAQTERAFPAVPLAIESDAAAALYGAHQSREGVVLVAGTGSSCFGKKGCLSHLAGGGGHLIDDEGSGYAIGRDILSAVLRALDGRIAPTLLAQSVKKKYGIASRSDIISFVYTPGTGKDTIAACAPLLTDACQAGDRVALSIAERAAGHLLDLVSAVVESLQMPEGPIAFTGSILTEETCVRNFLRKKLDTRWTDMVYYRAKADAADGAVCMARWTAAGERR